MSTAEEIYKLLSTVSEENIIYKKHFLERLDARSKKHNFIPDNIENLMEMIINTCPVHVISKENNEFNLYYNLTEKYDLVIVIVISFTNPINIKFIALFPKHATRRFKKYEGED